MIKDEHKYREVEIKTTKKYHKMNQIKSLTIIMIKLILIQLSYNSFNAGINALIFLIATINRFNSPKKCLNIPRV